MRKIRDFQRIKKRKETIIISSLNINTACNFLWNLTRNAIVAVKDKEIALTIHKRIANNCTAISLWGKSKWGFDL